MMKRLISVIMIAGLMISVIGGCTKNDGSNVSDSNTTIKENQNVSDSNTTVKENQKENKPDYGDTSGLELPLVEKTVTITGVANSEDPELNDTWFIKELEKRTGIKVELTIIPSASYNDKVKIILATGNLPDIVPVAGTDINSMAADGAIASINKYIDELPNFKRMFIDGEYSWVMKSYTADDGNLYFYPRSNYARTVNHGWMYRKDIFDKHGIKPWTNIDEFYAVLVKLKELYPESYPWANKNTEQIFEQLKPEWGLDGDPVVAYDHASGKWVFAAEQQSYLDMLKFAQKLYKEKLLDPEFLTDTVESWTAKMTTDKAFVTWDWIGRMSLFNNQTKDAIPDYDLRYALPVGPTGKRIDQNKIGHGGIVAANNDKAEAVYKLADYLSSPAGSKLYSIGQEGVTYNLDGDGKIKHIGFDEGKKIGIKDLESKYGLFISPSLGVRMHPECIYFNYTPSEQEAQDMIINNNLLLPHVPIISMTDAESEINSRLWTTLRKETQAFASKYVLDPLMSESDWKAFITKMKTLGSDDLVAVYNQAQERLDAK